MAFHNRWHPSGMQIFSRIPVVALAETSLPPANSCDPFGIGNEFTCKSEVLAHASRRRLQGYNIFDAGGVTAISQGLSAATPLEHRSMQKPIPKGWQRSSPALMPKASQLLAGGKTTRVLRAWAAPPVCDQNSPSPSIPRCVPNTHRRGRNYICDCQVRVHDA